MPTSKMAVPKNINAICQSIADAAGLAASASIMAADSLMNWPLRTARTWPLIAARSDNGFVIW
ncbi:MAG: hypothetical protein ABJN41_11285 [Tateyamaria sp.]